MTDDSTNSVRFTVKELLLEMRDDVKSLSAKLDSKAEKSEVTVLMTRVHAVEDKQKAMEIREAQKAQDQGESTDHRRWFIPLLVGCTSTVVSPFLWVIVGHVFK